LSDYFDVEEHLSRVLCPPNANVKLTLVKVWEELVHKAICQEVF